MRKITNLQNKTTLTFRWLLSSLVSIMFLQASVAQTVTLAPASYGTVSSTGVQVASSLTGVTSTKYGWFKFDLSTVPSGATITSANLIYSTAAGTTNSGNTGNQLNKATDDISLLTGTTLYGRCSVGGATTNLFTGSWSGVHPLLLQTNGPTGGSAATATSLLNYLTGQQTANFACFALKRGSAAAYNFAVPSLVINYTVSTPCTGTPAPGNTLSTSAAICSGSSFTLSLQNATSGSGVTYQWQSSTDNITFTNVAGATIDTLIVNAAVTKYYQCIVTCSGNSGTSTPIMVNVSNCINMSTGSITSCNANFFDSGGPAGQYAISENYTYTFYPSAGNLISVAFSSFATENGYDGLSIYDGPSAASPLLPSALPAGTNATTAPAGSYYGTTSPGTVTASNPTGALTFVFTSDGTVVDNGWAATITCTPMPACSGTPSPGNTLSNLASVCSGSNFTLSLQNSPGVTGMHYQWQSSSNDTTFTNLTGDTASTLTTSQTAATYYQCVVTCSGNSGTSTSILVGLNSGTVCLGYCIPENVTGCTGGDEITNVTFAGINNTTACGGDAGGYNDYSSIVGSITAGSSYPISVSTGIGATTADGVSVWIDYNKNGVFEASELVFTGFSGADPATYTANIAIPVATPGETTIMRVRNEYNTAPADPCAVYTYGETEDYTITITPAPPCAGTPNPGNTLSTNNLACTSVNFMLSLQNTIPFTGITYQWQSSANGVTYINIPGANKDTLSVSQTAATYYHCIVTCTAGSASATSTPIHINMTTACGYCIPENTSGCSGGDEITNVTFAGINNTTACGGDAGGYNNFTSITGTATIGLVYPLSVSTGTGGGFTNEGVTVWIDYNQNGVFEASELVYSYYSGADTAIYNANITIPATALSGTTKMRVRCEYAAAPADPCTAYSYGETEDYSITILYPYDFGVANIASPVTPRCYTNAETVSVTVTNYGVDTLNMAVNPLTVNCAVTGANPNNTTFTPVVLNTGLFLPGTSQVVTFSTTYNMSANGTYVITSYTQLALDGNAGNDTAKATFTKANPPTVTASASAGTICAGANETLTGGGATTYVWSGGVTNAVAFPATTTTTYTVTGTDIRGCSNTATTTVTVNPAPPVTANVSVNPICAGKNETLTGGGGSFYTWTGGVINGTAFAATTTTTYTVTGYNTTTFCSATAVITVTVNPLPTVTASASSNPICKGSSETLTGGGAATYTWTGGLTDGTPFVDNATATYTVTGTDSHGCINTSSLAVTVNQLPTVTASSSLTPICAGNNETLTGGGASTYTWSNGVTNSVAFPAGTTTTYTVTGTDIHGCTNTASTTVTVNQLPIVSGTASISSLCAGSSDTLRGGGANSYIWTNSVSDGIAFTATTTTTYTVTGTDTHSCSNTATVTINVNQLPTVTANASTNPICIGTSETLTGGGASTYSWSNGITNGVSFPAASTATYTVTGTDGNGCVNTSSVMVTVNQLPTVTANASVNPICSGNNETLTGGGASTYSWSGGVTDGTAFVADTTATYTVTGTDGNGCQNTAAQSVTVNQSPVIGVNSPTICEGDIANLTANGGTTYAWSTGATSTGVTTATANPITTTTYTVTGTTGSCSGTAAATVTVNPLPAVTVNSPTICNGAIANLTANGASTYTWSTGATSTGVNTATATPANTTSYTVTGTSSFSCVNTAVSTVTVSSALNISVNSPTICRGQTANLTATGGNTYTWSTGATSSGANTATANPTNTSSYTVTATSGSCSSTSVSTVTVNSLPTVSGNASLSPICAGSNETLTGSGASTYVWSNGVTDGVAFAATSTTTYTVTGTDANSCSNTGTVTVTVNQLPTVTGTANVNPICIGSNETLTGSGASIYSWSGSVTDGTPFAASATTTYTVTGTDSHNCANTGTVTVNVNQLPTVTANALVNPICSGNNEILTGGGASTYIWSGGVIDGSPFAVNITATYTVTGTDGNGCVNTTTQSITVNTTPVVSVNSPAVCPGYVAYLTANGATAYIWSSGANSTGVNTASATPASPTSYTVTGTTGNCSSTAVASVTFNPLPTVTVNSPTICTGGTANLVAGGAATYTWSAGATSTGVNTATAAPASTGTYTVTGTSALGCINTAVSTVTVTTSLNITVNSPTICAGDVANLTANGGNTYTWSTGATATGAGTATASPANTANYTVTATSGSCSSTAVSTVTVNQLPTVTASATTLGPVCAGTLDTLTGGGATSYTWDNGVSDGVGFPTTATTTYIVTGTDSNSCVNTASVTVAVNPIPSVSLASFSPDTVCAQSGTITLPSGTPSGGVYSGNGVSGNTFTPSLSLAGIDTVTYSVTSLGCTGSASQSITVMNCVGVNEYSISNEINIYPNPTNGMFNIHISNAKFEQLIIIVVDIRGREILKVSDKNNVSDYYKQISLENVAKGIYYIKLNIGADLAVQKLIVE